MKKRTLTLLPAMILICALLFTSCGLSKPEQYEIGTVKIDSITKVTNVECDLQGMNLSYNDENKTAESKTYTYGNLKEDSTETAKEYLEYLKTVTENVSEDNDDSNKVYSYTASFDENSNIKVTAENSTIKVELNTVK